MISEFHSRSKQYVQNNYNRGGNVLNTDMSLGMRTEKHTR